jgi:Na+-transporting methylmalonyl-CoA/oxaloacetate decarboxylase beta subunit
MKDWNLLKHAISALLISALLIAALFNYLWSFTTAHEAAAIGIIGGADGPTSIFISGKDSTILSLFILRAIFTPAVPGLIAFIIMMLLYRPVRLLVKSKQGHQ